MYPAIDLREQVVSFPPQPVITEDNLVVEIDTVLYFQVTDPRSAAYEIASYLQAVEQLTVTTLRNVVGSMDLEKTLTSRDSINSQLRGVLDDATGKWGLRVNRVEIKAIDPPKSHQGRDGEADARRARQARRDPVRRGPAPVPDPHRRGRQAGRHPARRGRPDRRDPQAEGQARAIDEVFQAVHRNDPDPKLLAYQYLQVLPQLAQGAGQHVLGDPQRGHLRAAGRLQGLHRGTCRPPPPAVPTADVAASRAAEDAARAAEAAAEAVADAAVPASAPVGNGVPRALPRPTG